MPEILLSFVLLAGLLQPLYPPPTTRTVRLAAIGRSAAWLHTRQSANGGFGNCSVTADAIQAIGQAGQSPAAAEWTINGQTPVTYLVTQNCPLPDDSGVLAKMVLGLVAAGLDVHHFNGRDLVTRLQASYDHSLHTYHPYSNYRLGLVLRALGATHAPIEPAAVQFLRAQQRPDGGWGWPYDVSSTAESDVDSTGQAVQGLIAAGVPPTDAVFSRADAYLRTVEQPGAIWPNCEPLIADSTCTNPSLNSDSTSLAIQALVAMGRDPVSSPYRKQDRDPVTALLAYQEGSGAFVYQPTAAESRLIATLDAINALYPPYPGDHPLPIARFFPVVAERPH